MYEIIKLIIKEHLGIRRRWQYNFSPNPGKTDATKGVTVEEDSILKAI